MNILEWLMTQSQAGQPNPMPPSAVLDHARNSPALFPPHIRQQFINEGNAPTQPPDDRLKTQQYLSESRAVADPMGMSSLQRLLGFGVPDRVWLDESHGLVNQEARKYR